MEVEEQTEGNGRYHARVRSGMSDRSSMADPCADPCR